ncbi:OmpA family protein [Rubritalea tangerina]|uniref:OmpA family protein n=1 Tax=Rubritalea tangerina TaxID=430798 RepID=A0ABW4ZA82_9BACT
MKPHLSIPFLCLTLLSCSEKEEATTPTPPKNASSPAVEHNTPSFPDPNPLVDQSPEEIAKDMGMTLDFSNPEDYMKRIVAIMQNAKDANDTEKIIQLIGKQNLTPEQHTLLRELIEQDGITIDPENPFEKIGDLKTNQHARWAINLKNHAPIVLDVIRDTAGKWKVNKVTIPDKMAKANGQTPELPDLQTDALNYTHTFLSKLLTQDFQSAKAMVDPSNITDAKLAGLCIIFEEAAYQIDKEKPLRALFLRETAAGFYANVISNDGEKAAQFSIITQRDKAGDSWTIYEINLDQLLGDYAKRVSGGDVHYTPLLKNPQGGDTLVIYFEFDSDGLTPRTQKQLNIVTSLLKVDPNKTITISGHTDAKGSANYNEQLSRSRAQAVKDYFSKNGVRPEQVVTEAHGSQHPRLPNTQADGSDNPDGRRANRRTEIYLDF